MTPKEKAEELVEMFMNIKQLKLSDYSVIYYPTAKQCALIAVAELLKQCWDYRDIDLEASYDYWKEVEQEIEKL